MHIHDLERELDKLLQQVEVQYKKFVATRLGYAVVCILLFLAILFMLWQVLIEVNLGYFTLFKY